MRILKIKDLLNDENILFSFSGSISQPVLTGMAETIEEELLAQEDIGTRSIHSVFVIFVEMTQNIMSYSSDRIQNSSQLYRSPGVVIIGYDDDKKKYFVGSGNNICKEDKDIISDRITKINKMDSEQVRKYYREVRRSGKNKHCRGAGLGFLEIAKNSSEPIHFNFSKQENDNIFFEIIAYE